MKKLSPSLGIFLLVLVLAAFGSIMVYSASYPYALEMDLPANHFLVRHLAFSSLGLLLMALVSKINYHIYRRWALPIFFVALVLCSLVFTPLGTAYTTFARRWLDLSPLPAFMPSDLMKPASIIFLAAFLSRRTSKRLGMARDLLPVLGIIGLAVLPIYLQPNFSTVLLIIMTLILVYFISGAPLSRFILMAAPATIGGYYSLFGPGNEYRLERIMAALRPLDDFYGSGWQLSQSLFAVASGQLFGLGLGKSKQKYLYLTEAHNDFIFAVIAEELGFFRSFLVILAFLLFIYFGVVITLRAKDNFGKLLAFGLTMSIGLQAFINIGVSFGIMPPTGLVLPFISYGGTSLLLTFINVGILLNISKAR